jgi:hypothetical protein
MEERVACLSASFYAMASIRALQNKDRTQRTAMYLRGTKWYEDKTGRKEEARETKPSDRRERRRYLDNI